MSPFGKPDPSRLAKNSFENVSGFHGWPSRGFRKDEPFVAKRAVEVNPKLRLLHVLQA